MLSIVLAASLLLILWPLLVLTWLYGVITGGESVGNVRVVRLPADDDPASWKEVNILTFDKKGVKRGIPDFFFRFLPGLIGVLKGDIFLVGAQPRSREQVSTLPSDWRFLYLRTKVGLITEASVMFGDSPSEDELYTAEAYYSATESMSHDLRLLGLWFWQLIVRLPRSAGDPGEADP